jgi:hypothetical protein
MIFFLSVFIEFLIDILNLIIYFYFKIIVKLNLKYQLKIQ